LRASQKFGEANPVLLDKIAKDFLQVYQNSANFGVADVKCELRKIYMRKGDGLADWWRIVGTWFSPWVVSQPEIEQAQQLPTGSNSLMSKGSRFFLLGFFLSVNVCPFLLPGRTKQEIARRIKLPSQPRRKVGKPQETEFEKMVEELMEKPARDLHQIAVNLNLSCCEWQLLLMGVW
jgi:hypothetical protein